MERMTPDTDKREGLGEGIYAKFVQNYEKLLEENKNLKLIQETNEKQLKNDIKERDELREENKKLKSDLAFERTMLDNVRAEYESLQNVIKKMKEENETLREELFSRIRQPQDTPYGKGVAELMEEDTLQELKDIGEL